MNTTDGDGSEGLENSGVRLADLVVRIGVSTDLFGQSLRRAGAQLGLLGIAVANSFRASMRADAEYHESIARIASYLGDRRARLVYRLASELHETTVLSYRESLVMAERRVINGDRIARELIRSGSAELAQRIEAEYGRRYRGSYVRTAWEIERYAVSYPARRERLRTAVDTAIIRLGWWIHGKTERLSSLWHR